MTTIPLADREASAVLRHSALRYCTEWTKSYVTQSWPSLSAGESVLWQILGYVNGVDGKPHPDAIAAHLDAVNATFAVEAIRYFEANR